MKISDEHKLNLKCIAVALICFTIDVIDGGIFIDKVFNGLVLWCIIGFSFGFIIQNYREHKK
jgi:hypothetical protein